LVEAVVRRGGQERRATARGRDIYGVTAPLVVEAAGRILAGHASGGGAFSPGEMFDPQDFLAALSPEFLTFETNSCEDRASLAHSRDGIDVMGV
jgi:hypothetical protein